MTVRIKLFISINDSQQYKTNKTNHEQIVKCNAEGIDKCNKLYQDNNIGRMQLSLSQHVQSSPGYKQVDIVVKSKKYPEFKKELDKI